ncbi:hypothetical protein GCM10010885_05510 [Alicyclobacillus cellulosilyticus]|uniref:DUF2935 family protein n=1 Tax=Alicyclobacillus cellulosilyticus TaxID=1003997 RepID=A0A917K650_9BACL|nr:DUF2935 domain-containing protein [Alicyclobacillus cellulosilyticus]GGI98893.1 hypothetical protein GCM10010885_05510 [Alicyclobacillus cellulosilyticus]
MTQSNFRAVALAEHAFWLQVLGDHARFIYDALSPRETAEIARARQFIDTFDSLLSQARAPGGSDPLDLSRQALTVAQHLCAFKLHLLRRHLQDEIHMQLPPTFLNHMVNENEEYLRILAHLTQGQEPPPAHPVHHHLLWLLDAAGHAATLANLFDGTEKDLIAKARQFTSHFETYYLKAVETAGYLRTQLQTFPALARLNHQAALEIGLFRAFLDEIRDLELSDALLASLDAIMPDHMAREECYYLHQLARAGTLPAPPCNPAHPRTED